MEEDWKPVHLEDFTQYQVSTFGNVLNTKTNKLLNPYDNGRGYLFVDLTNNGKRKTIQVHKLVSFAFLENPNEYKEIDHIDQEKTNNRIDNLRWCSRNQNNRNIQKRSNTSSKYKGVCWNKSHNKWHSNITLNKKKHNLGYFETEEEAFECFRQFVLEHNLNEFYNL